MNVQRLFQSIRFAAQLGERPPLKHRGMLVAVLTLALLLTLAIGLSQAQGPGPDSATESQESLGPAAAMSDGIPIQGRLTNASGAPLTGDHSVTFSLYDDPAAGNLLCSTNYNPLPLTNGLFNVTLTGCTNADIDGDQLYLGVQVDADAEMTPRQPIYAVPYARSLRPGADIRGDVGAASILALYNSSISNNSRGLYASATGATGKTCGVYALSSSPDGFGGYFSGGAADIVLGGTGSDDNGEIDSDPDYTSSDIVLVSNDEVTVHLDENADEDGAFRIYNDADSQLLGVYESGLLRMSINAGAAMTITVGDRYRDNATVAWAKVSAGGTASSEFGVASVIKDPGSGSYLIALDAHAASAAALIPIAIAEIESLPANAGGLRIVSINQASAYTFRVYINDGTGTPVDNDFVFMVTAR